MAQQACALRAGTRHGAGNMGGVADRADASLQRILISAICFIKPVTRAIACVDHTCHTKWTKLDLDGMLNGKNAEDPGDCRP